MVSVGTERRADGAAAAVAILLDRITADPSDRFHPVAWFGTAMARVERRSWRDDRAAGVAHAAVGVGAAALAGRVLSWSASRLFGRSSGATLAVTTATTVAIGGGGLDRAAERVASALRDDDLDEARRQLPWLVGRDPSRLDEAGIVRAVVESVAENTIDAVVAPALWAAVGGASGVAAYRAANTLDAMVGHRSAHYERFGWAAARLDDALNAVPARVGVALVAAVRPRRARQVWRVVRRDAAAHPSPNAGLIEAAFAAALGVRLGGSNDYGGRVEARGVLGAGRAPDRRDIAAARRLARDVDVALAALLAAPAVIAVAASATAGLRSGRRRRRRS